MYIKRNHSVSIYAHMLQKLVYLHDYQQIYTVNDHPLKEEKMFVCGGKKGKKRWCHGTAEDITWNV